MRAVGIVAEYNPFHRGHLSQLERLRAALGADVPVVTALSGDFVQRGEAAVYSKFARAEAAVRCGVSLVLELPLPWCLSSAEGFARGGVGLLQTTGVVDALSFGSESGELDALNACAAALSREDFPPALRRELAGGAPFAAARERAVAALAGEDAAAPLRRPNDLLAVEYLRAASALNYRPLMLPVRRIGAEHDGPGSASDLRRRMAAGEEWLSLVPSAAAAVYDRENRAGRGPVLGEDLRLPVLSRLRACAREDFAAVPDAAEGLENRLFAAARQETSPEAVAAAAKSKRYALSRLRRMTMCAALGVSAGMAEGTPPYLRVLAMDEKGAALLSEMRSAAALPVITKPAHIRREDRRAREIFSLGSQAHDLYVLGCKDRSRQQGGGDLTATPYIHF